MKYGCCYSSVDQFARRWRDIFIIIVMHVYHIIFTSAANILLSTPRELYSRLGWIAFCVPRTVPLVHQQHWRIGRWIVYLLPWARFPRFWHFPRRVLSSGSQESGYLHMPAIRYKRTILKWSKTSESSENPQFLDFASIHAKDIWLGVASYLSATSLILSTSRLFLSKFSSENLGKPSLKSPASKSARERNLNMNIIQHRCGASKNEARV